MMKLKTTIILFTLLLSVSLIAQDSFVRSAIIDPPATYPSGFGATVSGVDLDGDGKLEIYSVDGMSDFMTGDEIPQIIKYEFNGTSWDSVWAASFPNERQNTWAALTVGDLDGDGKKEIIWGYVNSFSTNTTPPRIVVFEANGDDILGVSDGAGNYIPNTSWDMDVPESTQMRPLKWVAYDIDQDGKEEVIFAERRDYYNFGIISVDDVPDDGPSSEVWTMEFNAKTELYNQFLRSNVIEGPDGGFGNVVAGVDLDGNGATELYAVNDDWNDDGDELIPTIYKYELVAGSFVLKWKTIVPGIPLQNTWPVLLSGDLDNDGLGEIIFCPANNLGEGNEDPYRVVVYEVPADSATKATGIMGIDNGDGTYSPNARWNMDVPYKTEMRPFSGVIADVDNDGTQEFVFGERRAYYGWGVVSVDNIPNNGDGSETWTLEAAGSNFLGSMNLNLTFEDDSDIANWGHWDEGNVYTTVAWNDTAGVEGSGALELGDGGYAFLTKRAVSAKAGANFSVDVDIKTEGWGVPETYKLYLVVEGFADPDTVQINSDTGYAHFTLSGVATGDAGYIKIAGGNTAGQNYVWVDNLVYTLDDGTTPTGGYYNVAVDGTDIHMFNSHGIIYNVDGANGYAVTEQTNPVSWNFRSNNNSYDIDGDGSLEFVVGDYDGSGSHAAWVFTKDADSLKGGIVADFTANTANRVTGITIGDVDGDSLADILVGFRGTDEVMRVEYNGSGDILDATNYTVTTLDKGVADGKGQIDIIVTANIDGVGGDEVFYAGPPRGIDANTSPLTVGSYSDTLTADAGRRWDMVVANGKAHFFNGSGDLQSVYFEDGAYKVAKSQPGIVNGSFLSASAADVDNDGVEEIITSDWYDAKVHMLKWINGAWTAYEIADFTDVGGNRLNGGATGDIDGDGNVDFVTGSRQSNPNGQIYRVEYTGGDITDAANWKGDVIDQEMNDKFSQYEVINIANLDDDPDLEVLYTSDYARGSNSATDPPFPIVILDLQKVQAESIADVRVDADGDGIPDRLGDDVVIKGVVTSLKSYSSSSVLISVQDETAGIVIYQGGNDSTHFDAGTLILVSGSVSQYRGLTEIKVTDIIPLGQGTLPDPLVLTVDEYTSDYEAYEGSLIKINAITKTDDSVWPDSGNSGSFYLTDGYKSFKSYLDRDVNISDNPEPTFPVNLTGIAAQYSSSSTEYFDGYQFWPRAYSDFEQDVAAPPSPYFFFTDETKALDGGNLDLTDAAAEFIFSWHPAVDLNGDDLIYQVVVWNEADGNILSQDMSDNNGVDTTATVSAQDMIDAIAALSSDSTLTVGMTIRTTPPTSPSDGIVPSVDTIRVTLVDHVTDVNDRNLIPKEFFVDQNYPNPFNPTTTIQFGLPSDSKVSLIIYDILGRVVATLIDNQTMAAGVYQQQFDASKLASGTYIYRLQADQKVEVKKMLLLK